MKQFLAILFLAAASAAAQTASISDTLTAAAGGAAWTGKITVSLNNPGAAQPLYSGTTSLAGWSRTLCLGVTGSDCAAELAAGVVTITLYANDAITPAGTSYAARFVPTRGAAWVETWTVEAADTKLYQIRATTTPTPTTTLQASQLVLAEGRIPYGGTSGTATSESYFTHTPIPASPVAGNAFLRLGLTGATAPSGTYYDTDYTYDLGVSRTVTAPSHTQQNASASSIFGGMFRMAFNPSASWDNYPTLQVTAAGMSAVVDYPSGATQPINGLYGGGYEVYNRGSGAIATQRGNYIGSEVTGASNVALNDGLYVQAINSGTGTTTNARGVAAIAGPSGAGGGAMTSVAVYRGYAYTYGAVGTVYGYRMTRAGSVNPTTGWGISEETGWPSRFNGRLAVNKLTDDGSSALQVSGRIQATLETPASSSAACVAGQMVWDANYLYVCVSTNSWKRKQWDSF